VLQTSTNAKLDTLETTLTAIETDAAALEVLQTSTNTKLDTLEATLTTIEGAVKAEDAAHGSGDSGIMGLAVRNDTLAALGGADGDYAPLQVNAAGALYTIVGGKSTSAGTISNTSGGTALSGSWSNSVSTEAVSTTNYRNVTFFLKTSSSSGTVRAEYSPDGTNWFTDTAASYTVGSADGSTYYVIVKLTNVAAVQVRLVNRSGSGMLAFSAGEFRYIVSN
jgi:hypothetical protein